MQSQNAKWVAMAAMGVMIGMTACNKKTEDSAARDIREESKEAVQDIQENAQAAAEKVREEASQTTRDIKESADKAVSKVKEEGRQATRDTKEGTQTAADKTQDGSSKIKEETRQTARDIDEAARNSVALAKAPRPGDVGATKVDEQIIARIRGELSKHNDVSSEVKDIAIKADNGKITLNGTVTSSEIRREMARITGKEEGVKSVNNELKVAERVGAGSSD